MGIIQALILHLSLPPALRFYGNDRFCGNLLLFRFIRSIFIHFQQMHILSIITFLQAVDDGTSHKRRFPNGFTDFCICLDHLYLHRKFYPESIRLPRLRNIQIALLFSHGRTFYPLEPILPTPVRNTQGDRKSLLAFAGYLNGHIPVPWESGLHIDLCKAGCQLLLHMASYV